MADQDDKVLKDESVLVQENPELALHDGPTEEELAAEASADLLNKKRGDSGKELMDTIEKDGKFMTGVKVKEHQDKTRDAATGAMNLDFLGKSSATEETAAEKKDWKEQAKTGGAWAVTGANAGLGAVTLVDPRLSAAATTKAVEFAEKKGLTEKVPFGNQIAAGTKTAARKYIETVNRAEARVFESAGVDDMNEGKKAA